MFKKILIANRGEIAVRVARTARRMGIRTVAVYSDADANAPHVAACDEAIHIGPAPATESYLRIEKIIDAMKQTGAEGVHPGYGFLSENAAFADKLEAEGLTFIGPTADTIIKMGSKSAAKDLMEAAGVPTTPGYQGADQSVDIFKTEADRIGYPVLLKATAGGGGKGMRLVEQPSDLPDALASAQREAVSAFGDDRFLIEKYIRRARHLEVQVFGDGHGNVVHMFERDCSVQRRHQKIIEEAPAPNLPSAVRRKLLEAGVNAAKAVNYRGAGTVEFLYDGEDGVYFMEMNTRLQVEHPVSELITDLDFVEWQIRIAAGEGLPLRQDDVTETGHAFEARLYAESPDNDFAPSIGTLTTLSLPTHITRCDSGVREGQDVTPYYDPMIAKIITHGAARSQALGRLSQALRETYVAGLETNSSFLHSLATHKAFEGGDVSTRFIDDHGEELFRTLPDEMPRLAMAAMWMAEHHDLQPGFRLNQAPATQFWIEKDGHPALIVLRQVAEGFRLRVEPDASAAARREGRPPLPPVEIAFQASLLPDHRCRVAIDGRDRVGRVAPHHNGVRVWIDGLSSDIQYANPLLGVGSSGTSEGSLVAPMPGVVTVLNVTEGDNVAAGDIVLVMEAMKMEHSIKAPNAGIVIKCPFVPGDQVKEGDLLVEVESAP